MRGAQKLKAVRNFRPIRLRLPLLASLIFLLATAVAGVRLMAVGTTRYVDDNTCPATGTGTPANPYCRIQDAICASVSGDTVSVARGTYLEAIRMRPGVAVESQEGAAVTTINAASQPCTDNNLCSKRTGNQCSVVTFGSGHYPASVLDGFTLTGGAGLPQANPDRLSGGGIYVFSSPTIINNVITNNVLAGPSPNNRDMRGAGVYVALGSPIISNNTISGNRAIPPVGGAGTTFGYGGGVFMSAFSSPMLSNNVIQGNHAGDPNAADSIGDGGGVASYPSNANWPDGHRIDRNLIADNIADHQGGGLALLSDPNTATPGIVTNNVIVGNTAKYGGGVYQYFVRANIVNNTITGNNAWLGGGIYLGQGDPAIPVTVTNNVIEGNSLWDFGDGGGIYKKDWSVNFEPLIGSNDLWGNEKNQVAGDISDANTIGANGNFSLDPRFVNRPARNFHLDANSPAIDRARATGAPPVDKDAAARGADGNGVPDNPAVGDIDVGAYEFCAGAVEVCDNLDNNCNGLVDDMGSTTCGVGACQRSVQNCVSGVPQTCTPGNPVAETCDDIDNDCNGQVDDMGSTTCGVGACQRTVQNCESGVPQTCTPGNPVAEQCDSLDNDCDGTSDEGLGSTTCGTGVCQRTVENCVGGLIQTCSPGTPSAETCDNLDNDCDGSADEDLGSTTCGVGACQATVQNCVGGAPQTCTPGTPSAETCDNLDNDCDGSADEGLGSTTCGVGACQATVQNCVGGAPQTCTPGTPSAETCDNLDNDCDGSADEGLGSTTCGVGACQATVQNCVGGAPQTCTPGAPSAETCDNLDNDCDGSADEGLGSTTCGLGACQASVQNCVAGVPQTCTPGTPSAEACDGIDNDCDGLVDDGLPDSDSDGMPDCTDPDDDNDLTGDASDCAPTDPTAFAAPFEVGGVDILSDPTEVIYEVQAIGSGTVYQVVSGSLSRMLATQGFSEGFCLTSTSTGGSWEDPRPAPRVDEGWYYLVRSLNACGTGTLGSPLRDAPGSGDVCELGRVDDDADGSPSNLDCDDADPSVAPHLPEVCDGADNNCDQVADEENPGGGQSCGSGIGECVAGTTICSGGTLSCQGGVGPSPEVCDGRDNDCDGFTDNTPADFDGDGQSDCLDDDDDNDLAPDAADCAPLDATAFGAPIEVDGLDVLAGDPTPLTWDSQNIGSGTLYDVATGVITTSGVIEFTVGTCLPSASGSTAVDGRPGPAPDTSWYYFVRSRNNCGAGTYGSAARDTHPACP